METKFFRNFLRFCDRDCVSPSHVVRSIGSNSASVSMWKNGSIPRRETLVRLADYFNVTVDDLLREDTEPTPTPAADLTDTEQMVLNLWRKVPEDKRPQVLMEYMAMLKDKGLL